MTPKLKKYVLEASKGFCKRLKVLKSTFRESLYKGMRMYQCARSHAHTEIGDWLN